jgi:hypothetical protein
MLTFTQIRKGALLFTYETAEHALDGYIDHYRVQTGEWAVGLYHHAPDQAVQLLVTLSPIAGEFERAVSRHNPTADANLGEPSRIAVVQAIQVFKAFAFEKLARGIGQANVDLT